VLVGWVFLVEGILNFFLPDELGVGRFISIGIRAPHIMAPFVGAVEIVCGTLILRGLLTRPAAIPLIIDITVAIISTKIPIWLGHGYWRFTLPKLTCTRRKQIPAYATNSCCRRQDQPQDGW